MPAFEAWVVWLDPPRCNLLIAGPCDVGKSFLACALGQKTRSEDLSMVYHRASRLFATLAVGGSDRRYFKMLRALSRADLSSSTTGPAL